MQNDSVRGALRFRILMPAAWAGIPTHDNAMSPSELQTRERNTGRQGWTANGSLNTVIGKEEFECTLIDMGMTGARHPGPSWTIV